VHSVGQKAMPFSCEALVWAARRNWRPDWNSGF